MVKLSELINDFTGMGVPEERDEGEYKAVDVNINGKDFEIQYMIMNVPLMMCLQFATQQERRQMMADFNGNRVAMQFQFYYTDEQGNQTQEVQRFPDGTIFPLIKKIGEFLKSKENEMDTILFGGDSAERDRIYDLFAGRIAREGSGWTIVKGQGRGPTGTPGTFWALFKNGS